MFYHYAVQPLRVDPIYWVKFVRVSVSVIANNSRLCGGSLCHWSHSLCFEWWLINLLSGTISQWRLYSNYTRWKSCGWRMPIVKLDRALKHSRNVYFFEHRLNGFRTARTKLGTPLLLSRLSIRPILLLLILIIKSVRKIMVILFLSWSWKRPWKCPTSNLLTHIPPIDEQVPRWYWPMTCSHVSHDVCTSKLIVLITRHLRDR